MAASPTLLPLPRVSAIDFERPDVHFTDGTYEYTTSGHRIGHGGMGNVWAVARRSLADAGGASVAPEQVVAKIYREEFLILLREDETARRRFDHFEFVLDQLNKVQHENLLPMLLVSPIADNYLLVSPLADKSLLNMIASEEMSPRHRVRYLIDALRGLGALHDRGIVHRDFTLHNILTMQDRAVLFDFDLAVAPQLLPESERTYRGYYKGRVAGSPELSVCPELLDEVLGNEPISPRADVYSVGTALFGLFTDLSIYGDAPDLASLLYRIAEGVVHRRRSRIRFPDAVPAELRPIIESCLEREPRSRYKDANEVRRALEQLEIGLSPEQVPGRFRKTLGFVFTEITFTPDSVFEARADKTVSRPDYERVTAALAGDGYLIEKGLGRVKGHAIFLAIPDPNLVAAGEFTDANTYRKIVTAIDLQQRSDGPAFVETWLRRIQPILRDVRRGFLTALHKVVHDKERGLLLLFSEYVDDPRFGSDLDRHDLMLEEVFALGLIVAQSIVRLHQHGLAHNNVRPASLVFKGRRDAGRVQALFLGLVEPTFDPAALDDDVRQLAGMVEGLVRQNRVDALRADSRQMVEQLRVGLLRIARGEVRAPAPTIQELCDLFCDALSAIDPNFEIVRLHGGDVEAYADLLVRHSLYNKLYALDVTDE